MMCSMAMGIVSFLEMMEGSLVKLASKMRS